MRLHFETAIVTRYVPKMPAPIPLLSSFAMLAPFRVRSFRFQWPADLLTSWGIEMENLVLGWYILVETGSVLVLTLFWALQYLGTLVPPVFAMAGDRIGHRTVLCAMRRLYAGRGRGDSARWAIALYWQADHGRATHRGIGAEGPRPSGIVRNH
jgi:hypothetical protein